MPFCGTEATTVVVAVVLLGLEALIAPNKTAISVHFVPTCSLHLFIFESDKVKISQTSKCVLFDIHYNWTSRYTANATNKWR